MVFTKMMDGGDFSSNQLTFPKTFQDNGYQSSIEWKMAPRTSPTGFDYSKVLINWGGQGTYYKPEICINGQDAVIEDKETFPQK